MNNNEKNENNSEKPIKTLEKVLTIISLIISLIASICLTLVYNFDVNFIIKILIAIGIFLLYFCVILPLFFNYLLFGASFEAYKKNLDNKKEILLINAFFFWTLIIPGVLHAYVAFKRKKNSIIDE